MMTDEEFRLFRNLIYEESGMYFKETRRDFLESRLMTRMKATGMTSLYWYYRLISETKKKESLVLLDLLTINETSFFRNRPQLDFFRDEILPEVAARNQALRKLRMWSAGCSTGEEPYTLAMIVRDVMTDHDLWDIKIFASDLSLSAIGAASRGEYEKNRVLEFVDEYHISRYFEEAEDLYRVKNEIKKTVILDFHNLKNDNGLRELDVIFCRNVMIYFDFEEQKRLLDKLHRCLVPGGYLFMGHAETLYGMNTGFELVYHNNGIAYKKTESGG
jgi:chemotaxis protein methyltransferase CheR